jgi:hypothetical protein
MNDLSNIFLFLSALFWATSLPNFSRYKPFDTTNLCNFKNLNRFVLSTLLIDIIPIAYILVWYFLFKETVINIPNLILTIISSFFIFGTIRIYHALVFTGKNWKCFYSIKQKKAIEKLILSDIKFKFSNHFVPGIIHYCIGIVASVLLYLIK